MRFVTFLDVATGELVAVNPNAVAAVEQFKKDIPGGDVLARRQEERTLINIPMGGVNKTIEVSKPIREVVEMLEGEKD